MVERHGSAVLRVARRYTRNAHDAEDAYQRAIEILLTKAPDLPERELVPWLKTVVKHEAFAVGRSRDRLGLALDEPFDGDAAGDPKAIPDEQAERFERLRLGAEALGRLKPQEVRCLLLRAEGYSYQQICEETGWTYTKVNRCLTEGRQSFRRTVAGIESGAECERLAPVLSRLADGEASAADMAALRPHLRSCLPCRAALRDFRAAPARVAAIAPPVALGFGPFGDRLLRWLDRLGGQGQTQLGSAAQGATHSLGAAAAQKAAIAVTALAMAGGGTLLAFGSPDGPTTHERRPALLTGSPAATGYIGAEPANVMTARPRRARSTTERRRPSRLRERPVRAAAPAPTPAPAPFRAKPAPAPASPPTAAPPPRRAAPQPDGGEFVLGG